MNINAILRPSSANRLRLTYIIFSAWWGEEEVGGGYQGGYTARSEQWHYVDFGGALG